MRLNLYCVSANSLTKIFSLLLLLLCAALSPLRAQTITSDPANGASGVSVSATITFTFSSAVDPTQTTITFYSQNPPGSYPATTTWSSGNTVVKCTPTGSWPANATVNWAVVVAVTPVPVFGTGTFSTGTGGGGGGGGSGTNPITTFSMGKLYLYQQLNASAATPGTNFNIGFSANTSLASNIAGTAVSMTIPGATSPTSLTQNFVAHEDYYYFDYNVTNPTAFEAKYPQGAYPFNVTATSSNLQATVTMPTTMAQPNAPHVSNFDLAQKVDSSKAFTVTWDAMQQGTAADFIALSVSDGTTNVFATPGPGTNGALTGTALSVTIPAATLKPNSNYMALLIFYRYQASSNVTYATITYRASGTQFPINTIGGTTSAPPQIGKPVWSAKGLGFDVATSAGQTLKVLFSTDLSRPISQWQQIGTTNSPGTSVHIDVPAQVGAAGFIRLEAGP